MIYLDHAASTPCDERVLDELRPFLTKHYANASNLSNRMGMEANMAVQEAKNNIASIFCCLAQQIFFTSGATESNNLAILGALRSYQISNPGQVPHLICSALEHKSVLEVFRSLHASGCEVSFVRPDAHGNLSVGDIEQEIKANTMLISMMMANNETGIINDVAQIAELARDSRILIHTDATQFVGKYALDLKTLPVDLLSFSGHKIYAPKGIGGLFVRDVSRIAPFFFGGGQQENIRPGTLNVPGIVAISTALTICEQQRSEQQKIEELRDLLEQRLFEISPEIVINGLGQPRLANISNISFPVREGYNLLEMLEAEELIVCSSGSACDNADNRPSHVMSALGKSRHQAKNTLRFSLGRSTTKAEILQTAEHLRILLKEVRI